MKRFSWFFLALASTLIAAWVMPVGARPRYGGALRLAVLAAIRSLDPADAGANGNEGARARMASLVFETMVGLDEAGTFRPRLATSWQADASGRRWELQLRASVRTHDGGTLTAAGAAAALRRAHAAWTVTVDGASIRIEVPEGGSDVLWDLADARSAIAVQGAAGVVGTGPFRVEDWQPARRARFRAHDDYWDGRPFLDEVHVEMGRRPAEQVADLELGRCDIVSVQPQDVRRLEQRGMRGFSTDPNELVALVVSEARSGPADEDGRQALALSVNRASLLALLQRRADPAGALLPQWLSGHAFLLSPAENHTQAKALIQALPAAARAWRLEVDASDATLQPLAGRLALDAREAGLSVAIAPSGVPGPTPDVRLVRRFLPVSRTDRVLRELLADLRIQPPAAVLDASRPASGPEAAWRLESSLVAQHLVVPLVHLPEWLGVGPRVAGWDGPDLRPPGSWNLERAWLRGERQ